MLNYFSIETNSSSFIICLGTRVHTHALLIPWYGPCCLVSVTTSPCIIFHIPELHGFRPYINNAQRSYLAAQRSHFAAQRFLVLPQYHCHVYLPLTPPITFIRSVTPKHALFPSLHIRLQTLTYDIYKSKQHGLQRTWIQKTFQEW